MELKAAVETAILDLDAGRKRIAEKNDGGWVVNEWLKKAALLSFRIRDNAPMGDGVNGFYDKVDTKFAGWDRARSCARAPSWRPTWCWCPRSPTSARSSTRA